MSIVGLLSRLMVIHKNNPCDASMNARKPTLLRSLFTVGLLCKHFDFDSNEMGETKVRNYPFYVILIKYENFRSKDFSNCWITISLGMYCFLCHGKVRHLLGIFFGWWHQQMFWFCDDDSVSQLLSFLDSQYLVTMCASV